MGIKIMNKQLTKNDIDAEIKRIKDILKTFKANAEELLLAYPNDKKIKKLVETQLLSINNQIESLETISSMVEISSISRKLASSYFKIMQISQDPDYEKFDKAYEKQKKELEDSNAKFKKQMERFGKQPLAEEFAECYDKQLRCSYDLLVIFHSNLFKVSLQNVELCKFLDKSQSL